MRKNYFFYFIFFFFTLTFYSQIRPSGFGFSTPNLSSSDPDGSSPENAASSAYAIKQAYPSSSDGIYWLSNASINGGTPFQIYADMTTLGGGWMLLNSSGGGSASSEGSSVTSLNQKIYLPRSTVIILSQDASAVMLANGSSGNKTQNKIISTDNKPINVFRSSSTSYMGAGTFHYNNAYSSFSTNTGTNWQWNYSCGPTGSMTGWPNLYHACGNASGVHYMFTQANSGGRNWSSGDWYSTWIR
jgi:hypothetical protein